MFQRPSMPYPATPAPPQEMPENGHATYIHGEAAAAAIWSTIVLKRRNKKQKGSL